MKRNTTLPQNENCYFVGNEVFSSINDANIYCNKTNRDVDKDITSVNIFLDTLESVSARTIVNVKYTTLLDTQEQIKFEYDKQCELINKLQAQYDKSLTERDLLRDVYKDQLDREIGVMIGFSNAMNVISDTTDEYYKILNNLR